MNARQFRFTSGSSATVDKPLVSLQGLSLLVMRQPATAIQGVSVICIHIRTLTNNLLTVNIERKDCASCGIPIQVHCFLAGNMLYQFRHVLTFPKPRTLSRGQPERGWHFYSVEEGFMPIFSTLLLTDNGTDRMTLP